MHPVLMFLDMNFGFCSRDDATDAMFYSYTRHINGFAATIEDHVAAEIASK